MIFMKKALLALTIAASVVSADNNTNSLRGAKDETQNQRKLANFETKIVGGSNANPGEYPWFAHWDGGCGGSLIHDDLVLSAAHCDGPSGNSVIVGAYRDGQTGNGAVKRQIVARTSHPVYDDNAETPTYDFIILKLDRPVPNNPVKLNGSINKPSDNEDITVIGFGATSEGGSGSAILQEVVVKAVSHNTCVKQYGNDIKKAVHLCAGVPGGGKDSCQGDSGGPIFEFENGEPVQVGVVSFGEGCARAGFSGVYARVSGVADWIDEQVCAMTSVNRPSNCGPTAAPVPTSAPVDNGNAPSAGDLPAPTAGSPTPGFESPTSAGDDSPTFGSPSNSGSFPTPTSSGSFPTPTSIGSPTDGFAPSPTAWWNRRTQEEKRQAASKEASFMATKKAEDA